MNESPDQNYLNMEPAEPDKPVYRIMPVHRLLECFQKKKLVLVKPKKWDDPFENMLLNAKVVLPSGESGDMRPIRDNVYGQCWTLHRETDAMWRIYSAAKDGAKVRSTPRRLLEALKASDSRFAVLHCFIGRVEYKNQAELVATLEGLNPLTGDGSGIAQSLLYKRREFSHEREVRLIYTKQSAEVHAFAVDPNFLFDEVVFDPRMDSELYEAYKAAVRSKGFSNRVDQSVLYRPPQTLSIRL
jgi:hypothetical protein